MVQAVRHTAEVDVTVKNGEICVKNASAGHWPGGMVCERQTKVSRPANFCAAMYRPRLERGSG
jgi:hypothetical protein